MFGSSAFAEPFRVLVLPAELFSVCENYYCFPEMSEIIAEDVIENFNSSHKIDAPSLYEVRKRLASDGDLRTAAKNSLSKFKSYDNVDFALLKKLSKSFGTKSILLISSSVNQGNLRRTPWEVMEVSGVFSAVNRYYLTTNAVLTDNVNDVVMWGGKFSTALGDNESRFWAKSPAQAASWLEKLRSYSNDIVSLNISQNIMLRFYPKVNDVPVIKTEVKNTQSGQTEEKTPSDANNEQPRFGVSGNPFNPFSSTYKINREDYADRDIEIDTGTFSF